jgi:hypothetical protein
MQNHRTPAELKAALDAIVAEFDSINIPDADLVPLARAFEGACERAKQLDTRIMQRVLIDGIDVPGAARKPGITHRKWNNETAATDLAFEAFGLKAFKLQSPAAVEKLGENGKALVAIASFKPEATDRVVY